MKKNCIIIPCKFIKDNNLVFECIKNVVESNYDDFDIFLVDSDSEDKSYLADKRLKKTFILDIKNKNYTSGALWSVYELNSKYEYYAIFHDSMIIKKPIYKFLNKDFNCVMYFKSWNGFGHKDETTYGFDVDVDNEADWIKKYLKKHNVAVPNLFDGIFGASFVASNNLMKIFKNKWNLNLMLESSKMGNSAMERLYGIVCYYENIDVRKNALIGDLFGIKRYDIMEKKFLLRR